MKSLKDTIVTEAAKNSISGKELANETLEMAKDAQTKLAELKYVLLDLVTKCNAAANLTSGSMMSEYIEDKEMSKMFGSIKEQIKGYELHLVKDLDYKGYIQKTVKDLQKLAS